MVAKIAPRGAWERNIYAFRLYTHQTFPRHFNGFVCLSRCRLFVADSINRNKYEWQNVGDGGSHVDFPPFFYFHRFNSVESLHL